MGLIDLKTDLKSLKYGKDKVGGGSSKQPFVQKPIPDSFSGIGNTGGLDMFVRGGTLAIGKTADDVSRLTKLLLTPATFQGPAFTAQQNLLSRQGVQTQASPKGLNEGPYLPTSTLAQVAVSATGLHFNKQGLNPIPGLPGSLSTYSDVVTYTQPIEDNRLVKFTDDFVNKQTSGNTLFSYPGGPGSILGAGKTSIQTPIEQRTGRNGINYNPAEDRIKLYPTSYTVETPQFGDADLLGNIDIEANQFGSPSLLNFTNTTEVTVNGPKSIRESNNYANLNLFVTSSTAAGLTIDPARPYQESIPGTRRNIKVVTLKTAPKGDQASGVNLDATSKYAQENGLDKTLYQPITGSATSQRLQIENNNDFYFSVTSKPSQDLTLGGTNQEEVLESSQAFTYTQEQFKEATSYRQTGQVTDFRQQLRNKNNPTAKAVGADILAPNYNSQNIENRVHLGNPGSKGDVSNYVDLSLIHISEPTRPY